MDTITHRELVQALTQHYKDTSGDNRHVPATVTAVETANALIRIIANIRGLKAAIASAPQRQEAE